VIDEQHRFGVTQRARLAALGEAPHVLVMTATPIPRTLATTLFGDLDLSQIAELPPGRRPVRTRVLGSDRWPRVLAALLREAGRGGKVFVVSPRIVGGAEVLYQEIRRHAPALIVHGRMPPAERLAVAEQFRAGRANILVGSTVVEVGLDVGDATWMVVVDAHRLGLSALHQLRGRVGRGGRRAVCLLLGEPGTRLDLLARCRDGFQLAEEDLRRRGPGELFGAQQSGFPAFRLLDPLRDLPLLIAAREALSG
jgi:ATP-dependent DNA helicase RecG